MIRYDFDVLPEERPTGDTLPQVAGESDSRIVVAHALYIGRMTPAGGDQNHSGVRIGGTMLTIREGHRNHRKPPLAAATLFGAAIGVCLWVTGAWVWWVVDWIRVNEWQNRSLVVLVLGCVAWMVVEALRDGR